jgi:hypothetical protein
MESTLPHFNILMMIIDYLPSWSSANYGKQVFSNGRLKTTCYSSHDLEINECPNLSKQAQSRRFAKLKYLFNIYKLKWKNTSEIFKNNQKRLVSYLCPAA